MKRAISEMFRGCFALAFVFATLLTLGGCATTGTAEGDDPLEPLNRTMYAIHQPLENYVARPVVEVYEVIVPGIGRAIINNFFRNIDDLFSGISGLLQGKFDKAGHDFGRVIINTGFGLGGLIDFASDAEIPRGGEDLGLLLAHWGVGPRPYLFVPLLGPMTARDGVGMAARFYASPVDLALGNNNVALRNTLWGLGTVDLMATGVYASDLLGDIGLDSYTFIRGAYLQRRAYLSGETKFGRLELDEDYDDGYSVPPPSETSQDKQERREP
ncbi:MAG: VacJ family lipoprotein [Proteobacteria bacterium]|nr:VacJ family lipoprotein [Pseudomonadota bacterium]MCL2308432.1 VacJ family lipoprotein [Pseudomonadota bacterium]